MTLQLHHLDTDGPKPLYKKITADEYDDWTLDICPDCQEEILKEIIGATPWPEGR